MKKYNKNSIVTYKTPNFYREFVTITDNIFEEHHVYINFELKYIVALFHEGTIWSEDEVWGTYVIDITSKPNNDGYFDAMMYDFYIGDPGLTIRNNFILNDEWKPDCQIKIDLNKLNTILKWK